MSGESVSSGVAVLLRGGVSTVAGRLYSLVVGGALVVAAAGAAHRECWWLVGIIAAFNAFMFMLLQTLSVEAMSLANSARELLDHMEHR